MSEKKVALVTGASSGFGELIANRLAQNGYRVFGTSRKEIGPVGNIEMLVLDVLSDPSTKSCIETVLSRTNRIDLLVNNAGQSHVSVVEETSTETAREILEVNFWGIVRITTAVLPLMRQQRSGHIINISSLAGLIGPPGQAYYAASKFALEGYSEALSLEVEPFNIKVSLIEPGFFNTNLHHSLRKGEWNIEDYQDMRTTLELAMQQSIAEGGNPEKVAELVVRAAKSKSPKLRYRVGSDAVWTPRLQKLLSESMFRAGMRRRFKLS
jgi:NAD(P)-dependent dehydrogenase (short-subunit alcohol dehydrogenase family)